MSGVRAVTAPGRIRTGDGAAKSPTMKKAAAAANRDGLGNCEGLIPMIVEKLAGRKRLPHACPQRMAQQGGRAAP